MVDIYSDEYCYVKPIIDTSDTNYLDVGSLQIHNIAWIVSGACVFISCVLSFHLLLRHFQNYNRPEQQKHIISIILMVPIYAIDSFLSFRFYWISVYFDVVRDCYEAFVIYNFYSLLIEYVGGYERGKNLFMNRPRTRLVVPLVCFEVQPKRGLLRQCKRLTLQYVLIRPAMTLLALILQSVSQYCSGNYSPFHGYLWVTVVNFFSVTVAMYALVLFYSMGKEEIAQYKPLPKFLSVKFVIFLSFWQSIAVAGFVKIHGITATTYWSTENIAEGVQDALTCFEMLVAAIWHFSAFSYEPFIKGPSKTPVWESMKHAFNPRHIAMDIFHSFFPKTIRTQNSQSPIMLYESNIEMASVKPIISDHGSGEGSSGESGDKPPVVSISIEIEEDNKRDNIDSSEIRPDWV